MRDRALGSTIRLKFTTTDANGAPVAPSSAFVASDFRIYKDGSASEKATTNGITVTSPFDGVTGRHMIEIDTSNATGDAGFWASGSAYFVELNTAKTVNTQSVSGLEIGSFSLELQTSDVRKFGGTAGTFSSGRPEVRTTSVADNALTAAALATDAVAEIQSGLATQTSVDAIQADTNDLQARLPAALEGGRIAAVLDSASVNAVADQVWDEATSGHTTAGTYGGRIVRATNSNTEVQITGSNHIAADVHEFQAGVITAGDFAANSITASALATDAVTEIQSGLASQLSVDTLTSYVDTEIAAIKAKTDNLPSDPADQSLVEAAITAATSPLATPAQVNAQVLDVLSVDTFAELSAPPAATSSLKDKLTWLFMWIRNKGTATATQRKLYADDGTTLVSTETITDDGTTFTKGEAS